MNAAEEQNIPHVAGSSTKVASRAEAILDLVFQERHLHPVVTAFTALKRGESSPGISTAGEHAKLDQVSLFPNPTTGTFSLEPHYQQVQPYSVYLYDASGKVRMAMHSQDGTALECKPVLEPGVYLVKIEREHSAPLFKKLVITSSH